MHLCPISTSLPLHRTSSRIISPCSRCWMAIWSWTCSEMDTGASSDTSSSLAVQIYQNITNPLIIFVKLIWFWNSFITTILSELFYVTDCTMFWVKTEVINKKRFTCIVQNSFFYSLLTVVQLSFQEDCFFGVQDMNKFKNNWTFEGKLHSLPDTRPIKIIYIPTYIVWCQ